ncbi:SatD family protein [Terricaulis silvestris]|uniref:SatD family (SatD) n=1 Tax=Terricaulis silvestris TaxID=2686094 RepID=A0A6I6MT33_9CAUL|nr:SatD family protein [Terricaulis silvestris]QGZ96508.1 hypothetical protein DSM104635_03368 [Terricaulis silvestris]
MSAKSASLVVLMGDIVGSEAAPSVRRMHQVFNSAVAGANRKHAAAIVSPLTITLGDEFQGLVRTLSAALEVALALRLKLLQGGVRCRFVIGAVKVETPVNTTRAWNMMGPGLADARARLNQKDVDNAYRFSLPGDDLIGALLDAVGDSLTQNEAAWTETQLNYYVASRGERTNAKVAASLGISERGLYKVLRAARADFHARQSAVIEDTIAALDQQYGLK